MKTLLLDADIIAYDVSTAAQTNSEFGSYVTESEASWKDSVHRAVRYFMEMHDCKKAILPLTDPNSNFRKKVLPSYKEKRHGVKAQPRPLILADVKAYMSECYETPLWESLEGDDVLCVLQTTLDCETIIVSTDKDMRTCTGLIFAPHRPEVGVIDVTKLQADQFLMWQTLTGDSTDGYGGCKGIGKKSPYALEVLEAEADELWDIVVEGYESKGFTEEDALVQARCAKILTADHYNIDTGEIRLWEPSDLEMDV